MVKIPNFATAAFAPCFGMPTHATSAAWIADGEQARTRGLAAVAAKRAPGTLVWSPSTS